MLWQFKRPLPCSGFSADLSVRLELTAVQMSRGGQLKQNNSGSTLARFRPVVYDVVPDFSDVWFVKTPTCAHDSYSGVSSDPDTLIFWTVHLHTIHMIHNTLGSKHEIVIQCWINVGPARPTLIQHCFIYSV